MGCDWGREECGRGPGFVGDDVYSGELTVEFVLWCRFIPRANTGDLFYALLVLWFHRPLDFDWRGRCNLIRIVLYVLLF